MSGKIQLKSEDGLQENPTEQAPAWAAVAALTFGVFGLVTAEFLPTSLLTPIASDLGVTEGAAGQAVTTTAIVAMIASLLVAAAVRNLDRRIVLLGFSAILVVSNLIVGLAPNLTVLILGRALLGIGIGGFWALASALAMRLVPPALVPKALSIVFSGVSAATVLAAPAGSYLGSMFGWRFVFLIGAVVGGAVFVTQLIVLPRMEATGAGKLGTLVVVLRRQQVFLGIVCCMLAFTGQFTFFTYIRPFLDIVTNSDINALSAVLLTFGVANFVGTLVAEKIIARSLKGTLIGVPLILAVLALALATLPLQPLFYMAIITTWGFMFGALPVSWSTWLTRTVPDQTESAGGLLVAAIQFAISIGAGLGGIIFDHAGMSGVLLGSALGFLLAVGVGLSLTGRHYSGGDNDVL